MLNTLLHNTLRRIIPLLLLTITALVLPSNTAMAQGPTPVPPDCVIFINNWHANQNTPTFSNYYNGCDSWTMVVNVAATVTALTMTFQSAPIATNTGTPVAGTFVTFAGSVDSGVNPIVSTAGGTTKMSNNNLSIPFVRVRLTGYMGTGDINGVIYGYKTGYPGSSVTVSGGCPNPCPVVGVDANGAPSTHDSVQVAGNDGTDVQTVRTDTNGQLIPANISSANADGISNTTLTPTGGAGGVLYSRVLPDWFNGSTNDRQFACTNQATITFSAASGSLQIVGLTAAQVIRVCHISLASDTLTDITFQYGTGSNCGSGTTPIGGPYKNVTALALTFGPEAAIRTAASNEFCVNSSATATIGGTVVYAKF